MYFHEIIFTFFILACVFGVISKEHSANPRSWRFAPLFSSSCAFSSHTSVCNAFWSIPVDHHVRRGFHFVYLHVVIYLFPQHFLKRLLFQNQLSWLPLLNHSTLNIRVYFRAFNSITLIHMSIFIPVKHYLDYYSIVVSFQMRKS